MHVYILEASRYIVIDHSNGYVKLEFNDNLLYTMENDFE